MVSSQERRKLMQDFRHEPACVYALLCKCVAGLLAIAGVALFGTQTDHSRDAEPTPQTRRQESASLSHSRSLYEERRARLGAPQNAGSASHAALAKPVSAACGPSVSVHRETPLHACE